MGYIIKEILNKKEWEDFLGQADEKTFLHSWHWGEFQKTMDNKIWRLGVYDGNQLLAAVLVIKIQAKRGTFLFVPHGPIIKAQREKLKTQNYNSKFKAEILGALLEKLKKIAQEEGAIFLRIQPIWKRTNENIRIFKDLKFRPAPLYIHPEVTWQVDLRKSEEDLLKEMRKTTRNLIRRGFKTPELKIARMDTREGLAVFQELYKATAERHGFAPFSKEYLEKEFEEFDKDGLVSLLITYYNQKPISGAFVIHWQDGAYYHHGASLILQDHLPTSYISQWQAIILAKNKGIKTYNFWGIAEEGSKLKKDHRYSGLTLFKKGFGGEKLEYVRTQDFAISPIYFVNWIIETFRRASRRLY